MFKIKPVQKSQFARKMQKIPSEIQDYSVSPKSSSNPSHNSSHILTETEVDNESYYPYKFKTAEYKVKEFISTSYSPLLRQKNLKYN